MHYVYVLKSEKDDSLYIGYANNVIKRVDEHNKGLCISTKGKRPLHLLYYEAYSSEQDARTREMRLKRFKNSYKELVKRIQNSLGHKSGGGFNSINDSRSLQSRKS
jgi:putative endonuclease